MHATDLERLQREDLDGAARGIDRLGRAAEDEHAPWMNTIRQEASVSAALYPTTERDVVAVPAGCRCGIRHGMTFAELRALAAAGSCTSPAFLCPELDRALRLARARVKEVSA